MRIVVDALGTDHRPGPDVAGAVLAAQQTKYTIILVGDERKIKRELSQHKTQGLPIEIIHADDEILMADKPSIAAKEKRASSMHIGLNLVKDGHADAFVTAGNTGTAYAVAMLYSIGRIRGVKRPALSGIFPIAGKPVIFLDIGANSDAKPEWLEQFAIMGSIYARSALKLDQPRVGLLSNGEEEGKGTQIIQDAGHLITSLPLNYIGNVEPGDIMNGKVDVVVADGFTGNILIKTFEASTRYLANTIRDEIKATVLTNIGGMLARSAFARARKHMDTGEIGGAPLLGVNGVVIIGHGRSDAVAVKNAILQASTAVQGGVIEDIRREIGIRNSA